MEKTKLPEALISHTPWERSEASIWLSTSFLIRRNYARYRFPSKITDMEATQVSDLVKNQLLKSSFLEGPQFFKADELSPTDREYLLEHFLTVDHFGPPQKEQGFVIDQTQTFLGCINTGDHFILQFIEPSKNWENTWKKITGLDTELGNALEYAFSPKFGFLTSEPSFCGTGLIAQAFIHLPAIIQMEKTLDAFSNEIDEEIFPRAVDGSTTEYIGDFVVLQNKYTLGLTEDAILHNLHTSASKLMHAEETLRKHIQETNEPIMKDKISRAFGLLSHSYQLQTKEVLSALSLIKLGIYLGWVQNMSDQKINEIFFKCRRAHLLFSKVESISQEQLPHKRAEYLHQELKPASLTI